MSITILNPGMLTSVQDLGRIGYQQYGVSVSGVMDPRSASIANILVGNDEGEAVLECTMMGPHIRFDAPNIIAITGGDLGATLDGQRIDTYRAIPVNAGQTLRFTMLRTGCRAFVAFAGGLDIPVVMGSRSTNMKAKIGGYQGRKLQKDDVIGFRAPKTDLKNLGVRHISPEFVPRAEYKLRVVFGPQDDAFTELGAMTFLSSVYTLTPEFDRMGCRLDGELTAGRLHLPRPYDLCEQRTNFVLPGFTGANAGAESQPSLGERRQQREFALVGARKLQEIRRKHERAELIFPSGGTNFVQFLTGGEEHIAVGALVGVVSDGERNVARVHRDDFQLRVPVIGDEIAVIGLTAVQRGVDLERERQCAVLFFLSAGCIHGENPF